MGINMQKKAIEEVITGCLEEGIPYLTLYAFSTENWDRPEKEIKTIFEELSIVVADHFDQFIENNIKFCVIGDITSIPSACRQQLEKTIEATKSNTCLHLTIAINYGGRAETLAATEAMVNDSLNKIVRDFLSKGFNSDSCFGNFIQYISNYRAKITPTLYEHYLYTRELPNVDLMIRTGGKKRMSNFLPWQSAYAELYFTDLFWPTFKKENLREALIYFQKQQRTFGRII